MLVLGQSAHAAVQLLPEMLLKREGQIAIDTKAIRADPAVMEILLALDRVEKALQKQDLSAMRQLYASTYNYHALHVADVDRIWSVVFEHYRELSSIPLLRNEGLADRLRRTDRGDLHRRPRWHRGTIRSAHHTR